MAKIIFTNVPGHGHVNPTLPVVAELVKRGHQVIYYNSEDFRPQIERTGADFRAYPAPAPTSQEIIDAVSHSLAHVGLLLLQWSERLTAYMVSELQREQPDFVIHDSICMWGLQSARILGLPSVSSITTFVLEGAENFLTPREMLYLIGQALPVLPKIMLVRGRLVKRYGKANLPTPLFPTVGALNIVYTSRAFQPSTKFIDERFRFVGPSILSATREGDFPFEQLNRKPVIYISLGTIHSANLDFYNQCFQAFADHPGQFILSVGKDIDISALPNKPANFIIRNSVPQLEVLQHADLFITHGGINGVQEGLYYGVPLVVIPQQMEQAINGKQVVANGAGVMIGGKPSYGQITAGELREALNTVLQNEQYREAAQKLGSSFKEAGGYLHAVEEIERFAGSLRLVTTSVI